MAIELFVHQTKPVTIGKLLPEIVETLIDILHVQSIPPLAVEQLDGHNTMPVAGTECLAGASSPLFLVGVQGQLERVAHDVTLSPDVLMDRLKVVSAQTDYIVAAARVDSRRPR
jgi:hypothetical protein